MRQYLLLILLFCYSISCSAQTPIFGGNVFGTWSIANSPYQINGDIVVQDTSTLVIESGVVVEFTGNYFFRVKGNILAQGTVLDSIRFTNDGVTYGWSGFKLDSMQANPDSTIFDYCVVEYARGGAFPKGACRVVNFDKVRIDHSRYSNNEASYGGAFDLVYANILIQNSHFLNNESSSQGGVIRSYDSDFTVKNSFFENNISVAGGAIFTTEPSTPAIENCTFSNNYSWGSGGAVMITYLADVTIVNNLFENNQANSSAGAVSVTNSSDVIFQNNIFNNNIASVEGGAVRISNDCVVSFENDIFEGNSGQRGGALYLYDGTYASFQNCVVHDNSCIQSGGGMHIESLSSVNVENCKITNNSSGTSGGGIYLNGQAAIDPVFKNTLVANNTGAHGGGIHIRFMVNPKLTNCTIVNNHATNKGGGLYLYWSASPTLTNCIMTGNDAVTSGNEVYVQDYTSNYCIADFIHCNLNDTVNTFVLGTSPSGIYSNNIDADPLFLSPTVGTGSSFNGLTSDWTFTTFSPCFNAGTPDTAGLDLPMTDLAGINRVLDDTVDIGAYEIIVSATVLTQSTDTTTCVENSIVLSISYGGANPVTFQWEYNGSPILGATNDTLFIFPLTLADSGEYVCIVNNLYGTDTSDVIYLNVVVPTPLTTLGPDSSYCSGTVVTYNADPGFQNYLWSNSSMIQTVSPDTTSWLYYTATDSFGCISKSDSVWIEIWDNPTFSLGPDSSFCEGNSIVVTGSAGLTTYLWEPGLETTASLIINQSGLYVLQGTDSVGCIGTDSINIAVHSNPIVSIDSGTTLCDYYSSVQVNGTPLGGIFSGLGISTGGIFDPSMANTGDNTVFYSYTDFNGCSSTDSTVFFIDGCVGIQTQDMSAIMIFPNPNNGVSINILLPKTTGVDPPFEVSVIDMQGNQVMNQLISNSSGLFEVHFNHSIPTGIYYLLVVGESLEYRQKLVIR